MEVPCHGQNTRISPIFVSQYVTPQSTNLLPFWYCRASLNLFIYPTLLATLFHKHQLLKSIEYKPLIFCHTLHCSRYTLMFTTMLPSSPLSFFFLLVLSFMICASAQGPPSPGYYPGSKISPISFDQGFRNLWGPQHQRLEQGTLSIWLDSNSGSGFKSLHSYQSGYFSAAIKLQPGYTAGVITTLYLSNNQDHPGNHDEIDIEFLGTTPDKPYVLQTNVYIRGSGDGNIVGREMKFHLWFDPTQDFHIYAILWKQSEIIFFVDDVPIRRYPRKGDATYPNRPMYVYGSIWDASPWATEDGKYKANYKYQPFIGRYKNFKLQGCTINESPSSCKPPSASPSGYGSLSLQQISAMQWVQNHYLVYYYCHDPKRDHTLTPEC